MSEKLLGGMGWLRDLPDLRDYNMDTKPIKALLKQSEPLKAVTATLPKKVDWRKYCSPIEDQESLGSCTAQAGVGLMEYYQRRSHKEHLDGSRLFLYKVTRKLLNLNGDTGAYLRTTMKAMVLFGIPPESTWTYDITTFDIEPTPFQYALAQNYQATSYYRLDPFGTPPQKILQNVKRLVAARLPCMFGFSVFSSIPRRGENDGDIPYPKPWDSFLGGHAVMAVGYDDSYKIDGKKGALLIRNSWSPNWGKNGYGWLPYAYIISGLAVDFWSLLRAEFVNTDLFN